ncbi:MAG: branched-chain amino acid transaminase [Thermoplasmatota archaeon]|nr:branched-chain amino acid transaminase [Candidatus Thermoplasmatota archaeon]MBU1915436.1 branched-chain amino acid transaminase [Candidatus Thermoplasmatota archaeon]
MNIQPTEKIWKNGSLIAWKDATVHVLTHGLHYGTGAFEGIRCYGTEMGPAIFRLREHMVRLHNSAKAINMKLPYSADELCKATKETVKVNKLEACYIRPIAFYGVSGIGVNPLGYPVEVFIVAFPLGAYLGEDGLKNGIRVHTSSWHRVSNGSVPATAKVCGNYLNGALAVMEAKLNGFEETIMLNDLHMVAEGSGENIFLVTKNKILTPPLNAGILPGITRDSVMALATDMGYDVSERNFSRSELYLADELFFTGTAAEVTPIREVDRRAVGDGRPGPITKAIQTRFLDIVKGRDNKYVAWLDPVK